MARGDREHHSDEFGRVGSSSITGADAPTLGAPGMIIVDGMVERESGATPPPPTITVTMVAVALGVMFLLGVVAMFLVPRLLP